MPISKINNSLSYSKAQSFGSQPVELHKLDDDTLYDLASYDAKQRVARVAKKSFNTILIGVPLADSVIAGVAHNGQLSSKFAKSLSSLGRWGAVITAGFAVMGIKNAVNKRSQTLDNFDKNNRILSFGLDIGALYGALKLFDIADNKVSGLLNKHAQGFFKTLNKRVKTPLKTALNNSVFNSALVKPMDAFLKKHPHYNAAAKTVAVLLPPAMAVAAYVRFHKEVNTAAKNIENNFVTLKSFNELLPENESVKEFDAE